MFFGMSLCVSMSMCASVCVLYVLAAAGVVFTAVQSGDHVVDVTRDGAEIDGSPFSVTVQDSDIARVEGVKVYGPGLAEGRTGQPSQFFIDTSKAGQ